MHDILILAALYHFSITLSWVRDCPLHCTLRTGTDYIVMHPSNHTLRTDY